MSPFVAHQDEPTVRLLVVDDDASKRLALVTVLRPLGFPIVEADSGMAALRRVKAQDFAVIVLDIRMPGMDGFETAALIRLRRESETTPIIFTTSSTPDEVDMIDRYAEGAFFVFAPVNAHELRAKVSVFAKLFLKAHRLADRAKEIQAYADRLRMLTDVAPIGIFQTDMRNRYTYTNPRWSVLTGISAADALGREWDSIMNPAERAELLAGLDRGAVFRADLNHRFSLTRPSGDDLVVLMTSTSMLDGVGRLSGWVGTLADITTEVRAEAVMAAARDEATVASQLKSDFLANMSHEIRTPMNGVIGMADLLLETDLDPHQRDYAQTVRSSGEALLTIINDILDFSKVEAGMLVVESVEFDVRAVAAGALHLLASPAQSKGLELVLAVEASVPTVVTGDPGRLRQIFTNLIGNAIKFTTDGTVVVRLSLAPDPPGGDGRDGRDGGDGGATLRCEVSDTGDGIHAEKIETIFQPFVQGDTSTTRRYGGTGLGLAIVAELVELMGGRCGVTSQLGEGSTFWFTVRVRAEMDQGIAEVSAPDADLLGVKALVVDDNPPQREVLAQCLLGWGMDVTTAGSGGEALAVLRDAVAAGQPFAVTLVDDGMPGMTGREVAQAVSADPGLSTRLVVMTALGQILEAGGSVMASLAKPVHLEELRSCLRVAAGFTRGGTEGSPGGSAPTAAERAGARLLLAEDNAINQKVAVAMLSNAGYVVDTVADGAAAVRAVAANLYDAILMDCQMPEMNGYEATQVIRRGEGPGRRIPIIAMTAGARPEDRQRCLAAGMDSYLSKPVAKDTLLLVVARSIRARGTGPRPLTDRRSAAPIDTAVTLDTAILDELRGAGAPADLTFVAELVDQFVRDTDHSLTEMRGALRAGDTRAVGRLAHSLRGSSGQLGGLRLASACGRLERRTAGDIALTEIAGTAAIDEIKAAYDDLRTALAQGRALV